MSEELRPQNFEAENGIGSDQAAPQFPESEAPDFAHEVNKDNRAGDQAADQAAASQVRLPAEHTIDHGDDAGRVQNVDKAWDMASVAKWDRIKAKTNRDILKIDSDIEDMYREDASDRLARKYETDPKAKVYWEERIRDRDRRVEEARSEATRKEDVLAEHFQRNELPRGASFVPEPRERAEFFDKRAQTLEDWAGFLHDNPASRAFIEAHRGVKVTPNNMLSMEKSVARDLLEIKALKWPLVLSGSRLATLGNTYDDRLKDPLDVHKIFFGNVLPDSDDGDPTTRREYWDARSKFDEASNEYCKVVSDIYSRVRIDPLRNQVAVKQAFIDDVRSGRAADPNYGKTAQTPTELPAGSGASLA
ncbi:MAG: hypothetical protein ACREGA_04740 [Candidatus Saccharimonadales bacterium]